ncbi:MAG: hypothetical protein IIV87_01020 [Oscillospiraceae bacterium]|nr:hypothetical protein [Oscillospiraceae bacterium]
MFLYMLTEALVGIIAGFCIAVFTKKADGVKYGKLDKAGRITNVLLLLGYILISPLYLALGAFSYPNHEGFLGILGWIAAIINASATLFCALGLGFSVALRKRGKSKLSFAVQFAGVIGIGLTVGMYCLFAGNLLEYLN